MRRIRRRILSFALVAGAMGLPVSGAGAAGWLPAQSLPTTPADIAVDDHGNTVAVGISGGAVQATVRPFGGAWEPPTTLALAGDAAPTQPKVTVDAEGNAVAVWSASNAGDRVLRVASRPAGGGWSAPGLLTDETNWGTDYALATNGQGVTSVVWADFTGGPAGVYELRGVSRPAGGSWASAASAAFDVPGSPEGSATHPAIGAGDDGTLTIAWIAPIPGEEVGNLVWATRRDPLGNWSGVNGISDGGIPSDPQVVVDRDGDSTVIWDRAGGPEPTVRGATRPAGPGSTWALTGPLGTGTEGHIAVAPDGGLTLVWLDSFTAGSAIKARSKPNDGTWSAPEDLATSIAANALRHPEVALDAKGDATAIWGRFDPVNANAEVARRLNGTWHDEQASLPVGALTAVPTGAIDPKGHVTLVWTGPAALPGSSSIFDPVTPELRNLAVPSTGVVGQPVHVSVEPFDLTAVTTTWSFDGAPVSGATASHTFSAPGVFTIAVTGEDAAGNTAEASTQITILPLDVKGPPHRPDPPTPNDPKPGPTRAVQAPALSGLRQTSTRWTLRKRRGSRVPVGTSFRFHLDRSAQVRLSFEQLVTGRRSGKRCVKATKKNRAKRACTRTEKRGTLTVKGKAGANGVEFRGKVGGRTLKPGRYQVRVTATADGKTSKAATKTFTIVR